MFVTHLIFKFNNRKRTMGRFLNWLKRSFKRIDLLYTSQFLRYKDESQYRTATGGLVSFIIVALSVILFYNMGVLTINREIITSSVSYSIEQDPKHVSFQTNARSQFMFMVASSVLDFNDPNVTYFDIELKQQHYNPIYSLINSTNIPLEKCTPEHLAFNNELKNYYNRLGLNRCLCPPLNFTYSVGGKVISPVFSQLQISIKKCNTSKHSNCASKPLLDFYESIYGYFSIIVPTISTLINADDVDYLKLFMEDRNYFHFNIASGIGGQVIAEVENIVIETDMSIMPYKDILTENIVSIPELFRSKSFPFTNDLYLSFRFTKSSRTTTYRRSFNKIDNYLSYIGGLIGILILICFVVNKYAETSYVISFSCQIFKKEDEDDKNIDDNFNIFYYGAMILQKCLHFLKIPFRWSKTQKFVEYFEEMEKQLNINYILKRIAFLDGAVSSLLSDQQIITIYLNRKKTRQQFEECRLKHEISDALQNKCQKEKGEQNQSQLNQESNLNLVSYQNRLQREKDLQPQVKSEAFESQNESIGNDKLKKGVQQLKVGMNKVIEDEDRGDLVSRKILSKMKTIAMKQFGLEEKRKTFAQSKTKRSENNNKQQEVKKESVFQKSNIYVEQIEFEEEIVGKLN